MTLELIIVTTPALKRIYFRVFVETLRQPSAPRPRSVSSCPSSSSFLTVFSSRFSILLSLILSSRRRSHAQLRNHYTQTQDDSPAFSCALPSSFNSSVNINRLSNQRQPHRLSSPPPTSPPSLSRSHSSRNPPVRKLHPPADLVIPC